MSSTSICWRFEWPWVPLIGDLGRYAENDRHHPLTLFMNTRIDIKSVLPGLGVGVLFTLGVTEDTARAVEGYEAIGHLTYTVFDDSVKPTGKRIIMFDVKVGKTWHVRTEPVIECKNGIAFQEGFSDTNNCIWSLTAFEAAYKPSDSPFQDLRSELKNSMRGDVYFTNAPPKLPGWAARSSSKATFWAPSQQRRYSQRLEWQVSANGPLLCRVPLVCVYSPQRSRRWNKPNVVGNLG